jgi:hypothetical protein
VKRTRIIRIKITRINNLVPEKSEERENELTVPVLRPCHEMKRSLERFARSWFPVSIAQFGVAILVVAYFYDVSRTRAPLPPDAPIEMQLRLDRNKRFSRTLYRGGLGATVGGLGLLALQGIVRRSLREKDPKPPAGDLSADSGLGP